MLMYLKCPPKGEERDVPLLPPLPSPYMSSCTILVPICTLLLVMCGLRLKALSWPSKAKPSPSPIHGFEGPRAWASNFGNLHLGFGL